MNQDSAPLQPLRYLGWTQEQWALIAGQIPGKYQPTYEDAIRLRIDWLNSMQLLDTSKKDEDFAAALFRPLPPGTYAAVFDNFVFSMKHGRPHVGGEATVMHEGRAVRLKL